MRPKSQRMDTASDSSGRGSRPLSPHLQVWRWHVTMLASILFRVTIGAASAGAVIAVGWLAALAAGPEAYARVAELSGSPLGLIVWIGLTLVLFSFILNGARHLYNDTGNGLTISAANTVSTISVVGPVVLTVLFWGALLATGKVAL